MPTVNIDQRVRRIVELLEADVQELQQIGVTSQDKRYAEFVYDPKVTPVIKHRKLDIIKRYLSKGVVLNAGITMAKIQ